MVTSSRVAVPVTVVVLSVAARFELWLVVIVSAALVVVALVNRWEVHGWLPTAVAVGCVAGSSGARDAESVAVVAIVSGGDRDALQVAAQRCAADPDAMLPALRLANAERLLDQLGAPAPVRSTTSALIISSSLVAVTLGGATVTHSGLWLFGLGVASIGATVVWSRWGLTHRVRPDLLVAAARDRGRFDSSVSGAWLAALAPDPEPVLAAAADVIERADVSGRHREMAHERLVKALEVQVDCSRRGGWLLAVTSIVIAVAVWVS